jgi:glycosyltransferase involved in cell wall biosynthesis
VSAPQVGIYRTTFPVPSEAFIIEQAGALRRYAPLVLTRTRQGLSPLPMMAISDGVFGKARALAFSIARSPWLFGSRQALRRLSLIHAHFGPDGIYGLALARHLRVPLLVTFHGFDATMPRATLLRTRKPSAIQFVLREGELRAGATAFLAVSRFIAGRLLQLGYPSDRVIQHYIGVDTARFRPAEQQPDERYILCVGRQVEKKGIDTVLRAFARVAPRHPTMRLVHIGSGPLGPALRDEAARLGVADRAQFLGAVDHEEVLRWMRGAEVFALASQTASSGDAEGLGIVFNEASACGVPVVATQHGGIPEAVLDGETGFLVGERQDAAMAERLDVLLGDRGLARQMGSRGRQFVCDTFDLQRQTARLEAIYDGLVGS